MNLLRNKLTQIAAVVLSSPLLGWADSPPQWGVDSRFHIHTDPSETQALLDDCREQQVLWFREPLTHGLDMALQHAGQLKQIHRSGGKVLTMLPWRHQVHPDPVYGRLNPDLWAVYDLAAEYARSLGPYVSAWELANEPDIAFVKAMPDQYAAWMKTSYLAIKSVHPDQAVLMGSMSLPPGPYLDRFALNGALRYTDAFNQHYYGAARDLPPTVNSIRKHLQRYHQLGLLEYSTLPIWMTECGFRTHFNFETQPRPDLLQRQADQFRAYSGAALKSQLDVFIAYCLVYNRPFALFDSETKQPLPAWESYTSMTREHHTSDHNLRITPPSASHPVVCQWRPVSRRSVPHKVSGTYRFMPDQIDGHRSMSGDLRAYNFSDRPIQGTLCWKAKSGLKVSIRGAMGMTWYDQGIYDQLQFTIPARGSVDVPFLLSSATRGYFRYPLEFRWKTKDSNAPDSRLAIELESPIARDDFREERLYARRPYSWIGQWRHWLSQDLSTDPDHFDFHYVDLPEHVEITSLGGPWLGINGIQIDPPESVEAEAHSIALPWRFSLRQHPGHPKRAPTAITRISGLPEGAVLRLKSDRPMQPGMTVRVDLIDQQGRRFTIHENFGRQQGRLDSSVWLSLKDFHPYFWGTISCEPLRARSVREIQLRCYFDELAKPVPIQVQILTPLPLRQR